MFISQCIRIHTYIHTYVCVRICVRMCGSMCSSSKSYFVCMLIYMSTFSTHRLKSERSFFLVQTSNPLNSLRSHDLQRRNTVYPSCRARNSSGYPGSFYLFSTQGKAGSHIETIWDKQSASCLFLKLSENDLKILCKKIKDYKKV